MERQVDWEKYIKEWSKYDELVDFMSTKYMYSVLKYLSQEYKNYNIYPERKNIFKPFELCKPDKIKVVILGNEPYFTGKANGLAFGNKDSLLSMSPELETIHRAVELDIYEGFYLNFDYTLEKWAKQGVLMLNTALTVKHNTPNSHKKVWDKFTKFLIKFIAMNFPGTIFLLWGEEAQKYEKIGSFDIGITSYVIKNTYPLKENINWKCNDFTKVNELIKNQNGEEFCIKW